MFRNVVFRTAPVTAMGASQTSISSRLVQAVRSNSITDVFSALKEGADPNSTMVIHEKYLRLPVLTYAIVREYQEIVELLLKYKVNIEDRGDGMNPPLCNAALLGNTTIVEILLDEGADTEITNTSGSRPLYMAAMNGHENTVVLLLQRGAQMDATNDKGLSAIHAAASRGHLNVIQKLGKSGVYHITRHAKCTALHYAAADGHTDIAHWLVAEGSVSCARDWAGNTAAHTAALNGHQALANWLLGQWEPPSLELYTPQDKLIWCSQRGDIDGVEVALQAGALVNAADSKDQLALLEASLFGHNCIVRVLVKAEYNPRAHRTPNRQKAFHLAAEAGHLSVLCELLQAGVNPKNADEQGSQAIHIAAFSGQFLVVQWLVQQGVNPHVMDHQGQTPAELARIKNHNQLAKWLQHDYAQNPFKTTIVTVNCLNETLHESYDDPEHHNFDDGCNVSAEQKYLCKVCLDAELSVVFLPCSHMAACRMCATQLQRCPVCREPVHYFIPTFVA